MINKSVGKNHVRPEIVIGQNVLRISDNHRKNGERNDQKRNEGHPVLHHEIIVWRKNKQTETQELNKYASFKFHTFGAPFSEQMKNFAKTDHKNKWSDADVERHWDRVADIYIRENNKVKHTHDQRFLESVNSLNLDESSKVLNISSRDCEANDYILTKNPAVQVVNAEISQGLMKEAEKVRPYVSQVKISTYSDLPFETGHFNRILTLETLEHVADPLKFLDELNRVSTTRARMVLSCPPLTSEIPYQVFTFLFGGHGEGPHRFLRSSEVKEMLKKSGWKLILHRGTLLLPVGPEWLINSGERIIRRFQNTFISELGIRQFFVCEKH
jgi:SAM-dependent methyltransferase